MLACSIVGSLKGVRLRAWAWACFRLVLARPLCPKMHSYSSLPHLHDHDKGYRLAHRLMTIISSRQMYRQHGNTLRFWRQHVEDCFTPTCIVRYGNKDNSVDAQGQPIGRPPSPATELPFEVLPRFFQLKYSAGLREEVLSFCDAVEAPTPNGNHYLFQCRTAVEHSVHERYTLIKYGMLRVMFNTSFRIQLFDFTVHRQEQLLNEKVLIHATNQVAYNLEQRQQDLMNQAATTGMLDSRIVQEAFRGALTSIKSISEQCERSSDHENMTFRMLQRFMTIADVVQQMGVLIASSTEDGVSPLQALQGYGKLSVSLGAERSHGAVGHDDDPALQRQSSLPPQRPSPHPDNSMVHSFNQQQGTMHRNSLSLDTNVPIGVQLSATPSPSGHRVSNTSIGNGGAPMQHQMLDSPSGGGQGFGGPQSHSGV